MGGDFNCLAPSDDRASLSPVEAALYPENASPIIALYGKYRPLVGPDQPLSAPWRTYKRGQAAHPTVRLTMSSFLTAGMPMRKLYSVLKCSTATTSQSPRGSSLRREESSHEALQRKPPSVPSVTCAAHVAYHRSA